MKDKNSPHQEKENTKPQPVDDSKKEYGGYGDWEKKKDEQYPG